MPQSQLGAEKANNLLALIASGLHTHAEQATAKALGDRSRYIGLSDIGRALECPRAALAGKVLPRPRGDLQKILTMQRGHWLEYGIGQALRAQGLRLLPQLEVAIHHNNIPIKAHLDFALVWDNPRPAVRILELKSTGRLPDTLYTSYEAQLYGQAGLLSGMWNQPAFSLRNADGTLLHENITMPELCRAHFGLDMPVSAGAVDIEAWVLCVSMADAKPFGPYVPDSSMLALCLNTGQTLWENKLAVDSGRLGLDGVPYATGFHSLCAYCDWNADCPKFHDGEYQPEWQTELERLALLKSSRSALDVEIEELENGLKDAYALSGSAGSWISTDSHRFRVGTCEGRKALDKELLLSALATCLSEDEAEAIIAAGYKTGEPYGRLYVNPINGVSHSRPHA